ncbi:MAG: glycosyltransferase [Streptococcus salivarius]
MFETDLGDFPLAAVRDDLQQTKYNSGVMLINNKYWREHDISTQLFEVADQYHEYEYGDQGLLNRYFIGQWKELDMNYNFMVGMIVWLLLLLKSDECISAKQHKKVSIIHYTAGKPGRRCLITV